MERAILVVKLIAILQTIWFVAQTLVRAIEYYHVTALEVSTVAFVFCSIFSYGFYFNQPQDVEYPVVLKIPHASKYKGTLLPKPLKRVMVFNFAFVILGLSACGFGAIHCLAWNLPFPTPQERLAWRICSVSTTVLPLEITIIICATYTIEKKSVYALIYSLSALYVIGRITIIVLAFIALRALPADAFYTVNWSNYIPHFSG